MAEIRVERKSGGHAWLWILLVVLMLILAAWLLDRAGYIDLPINVGSIEMNDRAPTELALARGIFAQEG